MTVTEKRLAELKETIIAAEKTLESLRGEVESIWAELQRTGDLLRKIAEHQSVQASEIAVLKKTQDDQQKQLDQQQKHMDKWDSRIWAFMAALLAMAAGLIASLAGLRRTP
jgi:chromosome segregation ATPase